MTDQEITCLEGIIEWLKGWLLYRGDELDRDANLALQVAMSQVTDDEENAGLLATLRAYKNDEKS